MFPRQRQLEVRSGRDDRGGSSEDLNALSAVAASLLKALRDLEFMPFFVLRWYRLSRLPDPEQNGFPDWRCCLGSISGNLGNTAGIWRQ